MTSEVSVRPADFCTFLRDAGPDIPILKEAKAESDSCPEKGSEISVRTLLSVAVPAGRGLTEIGVSRTLSPRWNPARWRWGGDPVLELVGLPSNRKIGTDGRDPVDVLIKAKRRAARDSPKHVPSYQRTQTRVDDR